MSPGACDFPFVSQCHLQLWECLFSSWLSSLCPYCWTRIRNSMIASVNDKKITSLSHLGVPNCQVVPVSPMAVLEQSLKDKPHVWRSELTLAASAFSLMCLAFPFLAAHCFLPLSPLPAEGGAAHYRGKPEPCFLNAEPWPPLVVPLFLPLLYSCNAH